MSKYIVIITNCNAYNDRKYTMIKSVCNVLFKPFKIKYFFYVGNPEQKEEYILDNDTLKIKCGDTYDDLSLKLLKAYNYFYNNYKDDYKGILKLDDDVIFENWIYINKMINEYNGDFFGHVFHPHETGRQWHFGKSKDPIKNITSYSKKVDFDWIQGSCYYVSMKSVNKIVNHYHSNKEKNDFKDEWYDDIYMSKILMINNIYPDDLLRILEVNRIIYARPSYKNHSKK